MFDFGGDGATTFSTSSQSQKSKIVSSGLWVFSGLKDFLYFSKNLYREKQFMSSLVGFTAEVDNANVKLVA